MSKGSKRRPGNDKKYRENYDRIFGKMRNDRRRTKTVTT